MKHRIVEAIDLRLADSLARIESQVDSRPFKVAAWGMATASVLGAVAAGFGAVAAGAGAVLAVRAVVRSAQEDNVREQIVGVIGPKLRARFGAALDSQTAEPARADVEA